MSKTSAVKRWGLAIAIAIVLNLFVNYGIATFYKAPKYEDYCPAMAYERAKFPYAEPKNCTPVTVSEQLEKNCTESKGYIQYKYDSVGCPTKAYCETCQYSFQQVHDKYESNVFFILVVVGVTSLVAGLAINVQSVGTGLLIGGIISILVGTIRNWSNLADIAKFVILGILLAILIFIGYRKLRD
ncbi:hypothetical protein HY640_00600 [Candidatus Woesearchaeota archaeon]|nr:hypothetical protein [Candidatus Woesearchaeota archaeon]